MAALVLVVKCLAKQLAKRMAKKLTKRLLWPVERLTKMLCGFGGKMTLDYVVSVAWAFGEGFVSSCVV